MIRIQGWDHNTSIFIGSESGSGIITPLVRVDHEPAIQPLVVLERGPVLHPAGKVVVGLAVVVAAADACAFGPAERAQESRSSAQGLSHILQGTIDLLVHF